MPAPALSPSIEYKTLSFKVETVDDDQGIITGYLSTFNNIDLGNGYIRDRVLPGAYKRTIAHAIERKANKGKKYLWPHLWMHSAETPIGGYVSAKEDAKGLLVTYQLDISKNAASIPNNPTATMVFSGYKHGYIDEQSIGYEVIKSELVKEVVDGEETMVRNLIEIRLWEGSSITSNFAMDPEALVTGIKSVAGAMDTKSVIGTTSGPIGPRDESWDGSAAEKWIWSKALDDDDNVKPAVAKKYFLRLDGDAKLKGSYSYPFWTNDHISVGGVKACANALSGARGASAGDDTAGMQKKIETLYKRINAKYKDDTPLTPPWDDGKRSTRPMAKKDFHDNYRPRQIRDWKSELYSLVSSFCETCDDAFKEGDEPLTDIMDALNGNDDGPGFIAEVQKWVEEGIGLDYSNYLTEMQSSSPSYSYYDYMSNQSEREEKAGRTVSAATADTIQSHADSLHDLADKALSSMKEHTKAIRSVADDLATFVLQGSEAAYTTDPGDAGDHQEGKATSLPSVTRRPPEKHSSQGTAAKTTPPPQDTVSEQDLTDALSTLRTLRTKTTTTIVA